MKFVLPFITLLPVAVFGSSITKDRQLQSSAPVDFDAFEVQDLVPGVIAAQSFPVSWVHGWGQLTSTSPATAVNNLVTIDIDLPVEVDGVVKCPGGGAYSNSVPGVSRTAPTTARTTIFTSSSTLNFVVTQQGETEFEFCVRTGLKDGTGTTPDGTLVGFRETIVQVTFTLNGDFTSGEYALTNALAEGLARSTLVRASVNFCNPGDSITQLQQPACLSVEANPFAAGWVVTGLRNVVVSGVLGEIVGGTGAPVPNNGQAEISLVGGTVQLKWLFDASYSTATGTTAIVTGTAILAPAPPARRLGETDRALAETKESAFNAQVEIAPNASSGGYDIKVTSFVLAGAAGAALFL